VVSTPTFDRRRAERFAQLIEEAGGGPRNHRRWDADDDLTELVGLVTRAQGLPPAAGPSPEFRTGLRAMLIAKIERDGIGKTAVERAAHAANRAAINGKTQAVRQVPAGVGRTRAALLIGVTAGAIALSGVSAASTRSLPGEPLYQVKLSAERAQLALAGSDLSRGKLRLEFARVRLSEARLVGPDLVPRVLADMNAEIAHGVPLLTADAAQRKDPASLEYVIQFVKGQRAKLADLRKAAPASVQAAVDGANALLTRIEARAKALKRTIADGCTLGELDDLGPTPTSC
jgi:hypothetical protein